MFDNISYFTIKLAGLTEFTKIRKAYKATCHYKL